jgi:hypothetical protein
MRSLRFGEVGTGAVSEGMLRKRINPLGEAIAIDRAADRFCSSRCESVQPTHAALSGG